MTWIFCKNGCARAVKQLLEGKPGEGRKKTRLRLRWMDDVELNEGYGCKEMENKSFGQDRMDI